MLENNVVVEETMEGLAEDVMNVEVVKGGLGSKIAKGAALAAIATGVVVLVTKVIVPAIKKAKAKKQADVEVNESEETIEE